MPARLALAHLPTPLIALDRLAATLDLPSGALLAKLDDATGLAGGGNKVRKLEYLCAAARAENCDVLVSGGGAQSNHARLTAAAARRLGFDCVLVLGGRPPALPTGNLILDHLLGAELRWIEAYDFAALEAGIVAAGAALTAAGRRPFAIPIGGSTPTGALGYADCAAEILAVAADTDLIVCASGSGGTQAGLAAGCGDHARVLGVDVGARSDLAAHVSRLAAATAALLDRAAPVGLAQVDAAQIGGAYAAHTDACSEAIVLAARREGLVLDPVYTGKAMAGLIAARRSGRIGRQSRTVFVHTGGLPALFTPENARWLLQ